MILATFDLQVASFESFGLSVQKKFKMDFSRWRSWRPSWISDLNHFSYFRSLSYHDASYSVSSTGLSVQEKKRKTDFQSSSHLGFSYFFYLQVTPMLPTKFQVNWPFGSEEEAKK